VTVLAGAWYVTRERISSVKPKHVLSVTSLPPVAATDPQVFLLVGSDSRSFVQSPSEIQQFGSPSEAAGARSDTIILVRIDPITRHVLVVSIPRDLLIDVPGCGRQKINAAFNGALTCGTTHGSTQLLVQTITEGLGVPINHMIAVQFTQFAALVDELGGLRIRFPLPTRDGYTGLDQPAGCVTLNGDQALGFVRSRHYQYDSNGRWQEDPTADLGRARRQQLALRQLAAAAETHIGTDPRPLLRALFDHIAVDPGFTADDALRYFDALKGDHPTVTMTLPVKVAGDNADQLVLDDSAQSVLAALAGRGNASPPQHGPAAPSGQSTDATAC
jgi:LCP family protein required for cell wall assembly